MGRTSQLSQGRTAFTIILTIVSAAAGGAAGTFAAILYASSDRNLSAVGTALGAAAGALVGVLWCVAMRRWSVQLADAPNALGALRSRGLLAGLLAGVVATMLLHLGLMAVAKDWYPAMLLAGQAFGIPAGVLVGVVASSIWVRPLSEPSPESP